MTEFGLQAAGIKNMLYVTGDEPCYDCTVTKPGGFKRLTELFAKPKLFMDGAGCGDIEQGSIGTCWLLSAMGSVTGAKPDRIEKLFCAYDVDVGVYGVRANRGPPILGAHARPRSQNNPQKTGPGLSFRPAIYPSINLTIWRSGCLAVSVSWSLNLSVHLDTPTLPLHSLFICMSSSLISPPLDSLPASFPR